jgi:hypothetical protein
MTRDDLPRVADLPDVAKAAHAAVDQAVDAGVWCSAAASIPGKR